MFIVKKIIFMSVLIAFTDTITIFINAKSLTHATRKYYLKAPMQINPQTDAQNEPELYTLPKPLLHSQFISTPSPTNSPYGYLNDIEYDLRLRQLMEELVSRSRIENQLKDDYQKLVRPPAVPDKANTEIYQQKLSHPIFPQATSANTNSEQHSSSTSMKPSNAEQQEQHPYSKDSLLDYVLLEYMTKTKQNLTEILVNTKNGQQENSTNAQKMRHQLEFLQKNAEKFKNFEQIQERTKNSTQTQWDVLSEIDQIQQNSLKTKLDEFELKPNLLHSTLNSYNKPANVNTELQHRTNESNRKDDTEFSSNITETIHEALLQPQSPHSHFLANANLDNNKTKMVSVSPITNVNEEIIQTSNSFGIAYLDIGNNEILQSKSENKSQNNEYNQIKETEEPVRVDTNSSTNYAQWNMGENYEKNLKEDNLGNHLSGGTNFGSLVSETNLVNSLTANINLEHINFNSTETTKEMEDSVLFSKPNDIGFINDINILNTDEEKDFETTTQITEISLAMNIPTLKTDTFQTQSTLEFLNYKNTIQPIPVRVLLKQDLNPTVSEKNIETTTSTTINEAYTTYLGNSLEFINDLNTESYETTTLIKEAFNTKEENGIRPFNTKFKNQSMPHAKTEHLNKYELQKIGDLKIKDENPDAVTQYLNKPKESIFYTIHSAYPNTHLKAKPRPRLETEEHNTLELLHNNVPATTPYETEEELERKTTVLPKITGYNPIVTFKSDIFIPETALEVSNIPSIKTTTDRIEMLMSEAPPQKENWESTKRYFSLFDINKKFKPFEGENPTFEDNLSTKLKPFIGDSTKVSQTDPSLQTLLTVNAITNDTAIKSANIKDKITSQTFKKTIISHATDFTTMTTAGNESLISFLINKNQLKVKTKLPVFQTANLTTSIDDLNFEMTDDLLSLNGIHEIGTRTELPIIDSENNTLDRKKSDTLVTPTIPLHSKADLTTSISVINFDTTELPINVETVSYNDDHTSKIAEYKTDTITEFPNSHTFDFPLNFNTAVFLTNEVDNTELSEDTRTTTELPMVQTTIEALNFETTELPTFNISIFQEELNKSIKILIYETDTTTELPISYTTDLPLNFRTQKLSSNADAVAQNEVDNFELTKHQTGTATKLAIDRKKYLPITINFLNSLSDATEFPNKDFPFPQIIDFSANTNSTSQKEVNKANTETQASDLQTSTNIFKVHTTESFLVDNLFNDRQVDQKIEIPESAYLSITTENELQSKVSETLYKPFLHNYFREESTDKPKTHNNLDLHTENMEILKQLTTKSLSETLLNRNLENSISDIQPSSPETASMQQKNRVRSINALEITEDLPTQIRNASSSDLKLPKLETDNLLANYISTNKLNDIPSKMRETMGWLNFSLNGNSSYKNNKMLPVLLADENSTEVVSKNSQNSSSMELSTENHLEYVTEVVWLKHSSYYQKPSIIIENEPSTRSKIPLHSNDLLNSGEMEILKPSEKSENLDQLVALIGNSLLESVLENEQQKHKMKNENEHIKYNENNKQSTMQLSIPSSTAFPSTAAAAARPAQSNKNLLLGNSIENQKQNVEKWSTFKNNQLNNDSLTKADNDDKKENANVNADVDVNDSDGHNDHDVDVRTNTTTFNNDKDMRLEMKVEKNTEIEENYGNNNDNARVVENRNNDIGAAAGQQYGISNKFKVSQMEVGTNEMSTIENKLVDISKHKPNDMTSTTTIKYSMTTVAETATSANNEHEMVNENNKKDYTNKWNENESIKDYYNSTNEIAPNQDEEIYDDDDDNEKEEKEESDKYDDAPNESTSTISEDTLNSLSFPDTTPYHSNSNNNKHTLSSVQTKEEVTTTNWWHSLPYAEIRKFLNSIFDSVTSPGDFSLNRSVHTMVTTTTTKSNNKVERMKGRITNIQ